MTAPANARILGILTYTGGPPGAPFPNLPSGPAQKLLLRSFAQALAARQLFARIVVATGDLEVAQLAMSQNLAVPFRLPPELCQPGIPIAPVLRHTLDYLERLDGVSYDWICWLQPLTPLATTADFAAGVAIAQRGSCDSVAAVMPSPEGGQPGPDGRPRPAHVQNPAFTLVRREVLRSKNSLWGAKVLASVLPAERSLVIRTAADFEEAERRLAPPPPPNLPPAPSLPAPSLPAPGLPTSGLPAPAPPAWAPMPRPAPAPVYQRPAEPPSPTAPPAAATAEVEDSAGPGSLYIPPEYPHPKDASACLRFWSNSTFLLVPAMWIYMLVVISGKDMDPHKLQKLLVVQMAFQFLVLTTLGEFAAKIHRMYQNLPHLAMVPRSTPVAVAFSFFFPLLNVFLSVRHLCELWEPKARQQPSGSPTTSNLLLYLMLLWPLVAFTGILQTLSGVSTLFYLRLEDLDARMVFEGYYLILFVLPLFWLLTLLILRNFESRLEARQLTAWNRMAANRQLVQPEEIEDPAEFGLRHGWRAFLLFLVVSFLASLPALFEYRLDPWKLVLLGHAGLLLSWIYPLKHVRQWSCPEVPWPNFSKLLALLFLSTLAWWSPFLISPTRQVASSSVPTWLALFLVPLCAEVLFRGILLEAALVRLTPNTAVLLSAVLFALIQPDLGSAIQAFLLGLACGHAKVSVRAMWAPIFLHGLHNGLLRYPPAPELIGLAALFAVVLVILGGYLLWPGRAPIRIPGMGQRTPGELPALAVAKLTRRGDELSLSLRPYLVTPPLPLFFLELLMLAQSFLLYATGSGGIFPLLILLFGVAFGGGRWLVAQHRGPFGPLGRIWSAGPRMVAMHPFFLMMVLAFLTACFTDPLLRHVLWQYGPPTLMGLLARVILDTPVGLLAWLLLLLMVQLTYSQLRRGIANIQTPSR